LSVQAEREGPVGGSAGSTSIFTENYIEALLFFPAHKPLADIGTLFVDRAYSAGQEFAAVFDEKFMATNQGELKAGGADQP